MLHATPQGASVLFFPEGTRSKDGKMAAFKKASDRQSSSFHTSRCTLRISIAGSGFSR